MLSKLQKCLYNVYVQFFYIFENEKFHPLILVGVRMHRLICAFVAQINIKKFFHDVVYFF